MVVIYSIREKKEMALPTVESITNRYLYKQDELVDNRLNERIIDSSVHLDARKYNSPNSLNA